ncbi:hypothetical protein Lfu02_26360 [Longispora fulva]|uniref:Uncharacterized protein n=1 Tax=Longispora fulva TaxID=619741 RepID=A0A8J7KL13_9ACTN|nr:hypothetical protein [Longispora fulva]MBG6138769.1 hypothetical protein [Longispora fulva]GIG58264.1 hypothetical protein Lfu02_26360 [Longispora fulva]
MTLGSGGLDEVECENVLWRGRPERLVFVERSDWLVMVLGVGWLACWVGLLAVGGIPANPISFAWRLSGLLVGTVLTLGHPLVRAVWLSKTWYTVTDRNICTETDRSSASVPHDVLFPPVVRPGADGAGSIAFGRFPSAWDTVVSVWQGKRRYGTYPSVVLRNVGPIDKVHALITGART